MAAFTGPGFTRSTGPDVLAPRLIGDHDSGSSGELCVLRTLLRSLHGHRGIVVGPDRGRAAGEGHREISDPKMLLRMVEEVVQRLARSDRGKPREAQNELVTSP